MWKMPSRKSPPSAASSSEILPQSIRTPIRRPDGSGLPCRLLRAAPAGGRGLRGGGLRAAAPGALLRRRRVALPQQLAQVPAHLRRDVDHGALAVEDDRLLD